MDTAVSKTNEFLKITMSHALRWPKPLVKGARLPLKREQEFILHT
jgi:hypothetical protein